MPEFNWLKAFANAASEANAIVLDRDRGGRNAATSVEDQFTPSDEETSALFLIDIIEMKLKRARSYYRAGNWPKFKEEMQDCANYSLFPIAIEDQGGGHYLRGSWESTRPAPEGGFAAGIQKIAEELKKA